MSVPVDCESASAAVTLVPFESGCELYSVVLLSTLCWLARSWVLTRAIGVKRGGDAGLVGIPQCGPQCLAHGLAAGAASDREDQIVLEWHLADDVALVVAKRANHFRD